MGLIFFCLLLVAAHGCFTSTTIGLCAVDCSSTNANCYCDYYKGCSFRCGSFANETETALDSGSFCAVNGCSAQCSPHFVAVCTTWQGCGCQRSPCSRVRENEIVRSGVVALCLNVTDKTPPASLDRIFAICPATSVYFCALRGKMINERTCKCC